MKDDIFRYTGYGRAAYAKLAKAGVSIPENFAFYEAEVVGRGVQSIRMKGAQFRQATRGKNKGEWNQIVPGTEVEVFISKEEIDEHEPASG